MITIFQTITTPGFGNCFEACVASLLELPLDAIPPLGCGDAGKLQEFLKTFGLCPIWIRVSGLDSAWVGYSPDHGILTGVSPRGVGRHHAVVARPSGYGFEIVHDPHPDGGGIVGAPETVLYFGTVLPSSS